MNRVSSVSNQAFPPALNGTLEVVTFFAGGQRCAVEARQVRALRSIAADDGADYPTIDALLGLPEQNTTCSQRRIMTIRLPAADVEFSVAAPVQLERFACDIIHPLPPLPAVRTQLRGLRALAMERDGVTLIFDLRNLLSDF